MTHKLIAVRDRLCFLWWPLYPAWTKPLRSTDGHCNHSQADWLAHEPDKKGVAFGKN